MKRNRQFDSSQIGAEVTTGLGDRRNQFLPDIGGKFDEFGDRSTFEIGGRGDLFEDRHVNGTPSGPQGDQSTSGSRWMRVEPEFDGLM